MKLEYCRIEQFDDNDASIALGFSVPFGVSAELVTEIGRRIENFLMNISPAGDNVSTVKLSGILAPGAEICVATVVAPTKRTRAPKAETPEPAGSVAEITPPRRTRAPKAEAPEAVESVAEITPAPRRTRAPAPVAAPEITDMDLAKAASGAAEILGTQIVKDIIAEMGVKTVNEIEGFEKRQYFLGLLNAEKELVAGEKANG